ncbi:WD40 repeat-containing protein [Rubidibacter lacunae KORDI 51-2]|uniref:WD40 repeat-containing protein n=2 Tax=Rubidibacter TaxID=582491 RepID=U5DPM0_9CHRO|nr:WD40 repeat-containing protein [Rubidibacter lacunae KORDI 51-2]
MNGELAELAAIATATVGAVSTLFVDVQIAPVALLLLALALFLELANRRRSEQRSRHQSDQIRRQLQQQSQAIALLNDRLAAATAPVPPRIGDTDARVVREQLTAVEQSLSQVVQYLDRSALPGRVERIEGEIARLQNTRIAVSREPMSTPDPSPPAVASPPIAWTLRHTLPAHTDVVSALAIAPGRFAVSVSWDRTLQVRDLTSGAIIAEPVTSPRGFRSVAAGRLLATGSFDREVELWQCEGELPTLEIAAAQTLTGHQGSVRALAALPDGMSLFSGSYDGTLKSWDWDGRLLDSCADASGVIHALALEPHGRWLASGGGAGTLTLWSLDPLAPTGYLQGNLHTVESLAVSPDGTLVAAGCIDGAVRIWAVPTGDRPNASEPIATLGGRNGQVMAVAFVPDAPFLLGGGVDGAISLWHVPSWQPIAALNAQGNTGSKVASEGIASFAIASDGNYLVAGGANGTLWIWERSR